ncbi:MAG: flippase-like domain-containing protein [Flavobacteriales bacterium]|nr:flippase-like domain-containing protein [Flavobacteriales bacterium]
MDQDKFLRALRPSRIIYPILLGLGVAGFMIYDDFELNALLSINWTWHAGIWAIVAISMMLFRDAAYIYRIKVLTSDELSWKQSFQVIMLWEFASAITPSIVGGSAVAVYIVHKELNNVGKSTAIVMASSLLDELFYVFMVPILYLLISKGVLFSIQGSSALHELTHGYGIYMFGFGYLFIVTYSVIILYALFYNPRVIKWTFIKVFSLPFFRKWRTAAAKAGDDLIIASKEIKGKKKRFWVKAGFATFVSWTARFWVVNFLILVPLGAGIAFSDHILIYGRQLLMWVIMLVSPTPGGAGFAEVAFTVFLSEFIDKGLISSMAVMWRLISYFPYLFIGIAVLPIWIKRVYGK